MIAALAVNAVILVILGVYGRVRIYVPNKPADSISVVLVDLPTLAPIPNLRDPEKAPEPTPIEEPEPVREPEPVPEPEPIPEPEPEPTPEKAEPAPAPPVEEPAPAPQPDLTVREEFAAPLETPAPPRLPDPPSAAAPEGPIAGDLTVTGEQTPARNAPPLTTPEQATPSPQPGPAARTADETGPKKNEEDPAGDEPKPAVAAAPKAAPSGDDAFDQAPAFSGSRFSLPKVDLPKGSAAAPGTSGVVAVFCPEEFTNKEKAAECAGRTEIRSGWRPGASGEDFSKAAKVLQQRRQEGDFSGDAVTFGPAIAREADEARRRRDLEDFRKSQGSVNDLGTNQTGDPAAASRPGIGPADFEPSWTKREDPLVDQKDVDKLKRDLEQAEKDKTGGN